LLWVSWRLWQGRWQVQVTFLAAGIKAGDKKHNAENGEDLFVVHGSIDV